MNQTEKKDAAAQEDNTELVEDIMDGMYLVTLARPFKFEGKDYNRIDLSGLHDINASDMIAVSRRLSRNGNVDFMQEITLEYALNLAARATGMPMEFFELLPPYAAMAIKNKITSFLYRPE